MSIVLKFGFLFHFDVSRPMECLWRCVAGFLVGPQRFPVVEVFASSE